MLLELLYWHWWVVGLVLVVVEGVYPSGIFGAMSIGAIVTGAVSWLQYDLSNAAQLALFTSIMLPSYFAVQYFRKRSERKNQIDRTDPKSYIGREFELTSNVQNGYSEIELDNIVWTLKGPELRAGDLVRVVDTDTDILVIYPIKMARAESTPS